MFKEGIDSHWREDSVYSEELCKNDRVFKLTLHVTFVLLPVWKSMAVISGVVS